MYVRATTGRSARAAVLASLALAAGCSHMPWHHQPAPPPTEVHELDISGASAGTHFPQYWKRNTLLVDLSSASGSGSLVLKPVAGSTWPVRIAMRVTPGAIGALEVRGDQGVTVPITAGKGPVDLELNPQVYSAHTPELDVGWGPAAAVPELPPPTPRR
jgi:hypothetical protein